MVFHEGQSMVLTVRTWNRLQFLLRTTVLIYCKNIAILHLNAKPDRVVSVRWAEIKKERVCCTWKRRQSLGRQTLFIACGDEKQEEYDEEVKQSEMELRSEECLMKIQGSSCRGGSIIGRGIPSLGKTCLLTQKRLFLVCGISMRAYG
jgi:hypothetical protein